MCSKYFFGFEISVYLTFFGVCKAILSNNSLSVAPPNQAPVSGCRQSSYVLIRNVCLCASVCACENV